MADYRISDLVERFARGELSRRDFIRRAGIAGLSATAIGSVLASDAVAAPISRASRSARGQVDASTLVIADALSGGAWLTLDPAWFYEISSAAIMNVVYETLYHLPDGDQPEN